MPESHDWWTANLERSRTTLELPQCGQSGWLTSENERKK